MIKKDYFPLECQETLDSIAIIIKEARLKQKLRQSDLAQRVGISVSTLRKIEAGDRRVEWGTVLHLLWQLNALRQVIAVDRDFATQHSEPAASRRVRLPSVKPEDF